MILQIWASLKNIFSFFSGWVFARWIELSKTIEERRKETKEILEAQRKNNIREASHDAHISKIINGVRDGTLSESDIARMLSTYPPENTETNSASTPTGGDRKLSS